MHVLQCNAMQCLSKLMASIETYCVYYLYLFGVSIYCQLNILKSEAKKNQLLSDLRLHNPWTGQASDHYATLILASVAMALGHNPSQPALNKELVRQA